MKPRTLFASILSLGLLTASASAQTPSGDEIGAATAVKATVDVSRVAPTKLVSGPDGQVVVVSGRKISSNLAQQKTIARLSSAPMSLALIKAKATSPQIQISSASLSPLAKAKARTSGAVTTSTAATLVTTDARTGFTPSQAPVVGMTGRASRTTTTVTRSDTLVVTADRATATTSSSAANPLASSIESQVFIGDLPRDTSLASRGLTAATTVTATGATVIGANGFPILFGSAALQSGTNPIGPNGFPQPITTGAQTGMQRIGTDGFPNLVPAFAQSGTRAGVMRGTTAATTTVGRGATATTVSAPNAATAVMTGPAVAAAAASPK
ncbi:MAG TPA: hypothetical protein VIY96_10530 [Thermoanaerobaculia bacterium]